MSIIENLSLKKLKILCVEDDKPLLDILKSDLESEIEAKVVTASDGFEGYKKARNQTFDLIITDYRMPRLDGNDLITALRETEMNQKTPIIIHTGYADQILTELNPSYKNIDVLEKPASPEELFETIDILLKGGSRISRFKVKKETPKTDVSFLNAFIDSTLYTLHQMTELKDIENEKAYLYAEQNLDVSISANITMLSPMFSGILGIGFREEVFLQITSNLLQEEQNEINAENRDAAGEIINIIYGQTKLRLSSLGFQLQRAIPSIVTGKGHQTYADSSMKTLVVPFHSLEGDFFIFISLKSK